MRREGKVSMGAGPRSLPDPWLDLGPPRPVLIPQDPRGAGPGLGLCPLS